MTSITWVGSKVLPSGSCLNRFMNLSSRYFYQQCNLPQGHEFFRRIFFQGRSQKRGMCSWCWKPACALHADLFQEQSIHTWRNAVLTSSMQFGWTSLKEAIGEEKKRCRGCFFSHKHLNCLMFCFVSHWMWLKGNRLFFLPFPLFYFLWLYKTCAINSVAVSSVWPSDASTWMIHALDGSLIKFNKSVPLL